MRKQNFKHQEAFEKNLETISHSDIKRMRPLSSIGHVQLFDDRKTTNTYMVFYGRFNQFYYSKCLRTATAYFNKLVRQQPY
ncbi:MAG: hypothetical protein EVB11_13125 [Winogradskyella sp.]|nr:MAG: hypothetical protein EVB11_13125 [Winogradskyella sp.]